MSIIIGKNPIKGAIEAKKLKKVYIAEGFKDEKILSLVKNAKLPVIVAPKNKLDSLAHGGVHQGIVGEVENYHTYGLEEVISDGKKKENPIMVMLDGLSDPHNLGAILRSADAFDVSGVIYKKKGSVSLNETVSKVSTGAINFIKCVEVSNLSNAIEKLKKAGYWIVALDGDSNTTLTQLPKNTPLCIVVGSEGYGISRLVKENCDIIAKIPMYGKVNCLNASLACGIALYSIRNL